MLTVQTLLNGPIEENCYVINMDGQAGAMVIDPGSSAAQLKKAIDQAGLNPLLILATHGHFDHVGAVYALSEAYQAPFGCHPADSETLDTLEDTYMFYGMGTTKRPKISREIQDGDLIEGGGITLRAIHTPGHTPGGLCFYHEASKSLFSGDTLFRRSIGRSDFEGGDAGILTASIREKLFKLPDDCKVYPGHGEPTTIGEEKRENPFVR